MAGGALARHKKGAEAEGRTIVFADQSAFYLLCCLVRTYAPIGRTPVLRHKCTHDHLSVMSAITPEGKLYTMTRDKAFNSQAIILFLMHLLTLIPGKILLVWDGAPIHRSQQLKEWLATLEPGRLKLERLPAYAPDLNPDEGVWRYLKGVEMKNLCCDHIDHLKHELRKAIERLRHKTHILQACFQHAGCV